MEAKAKKRIKAKVKKEKENKKHEEPRVIDVCKKSELLSGVVITGLIFFSVNYAYAFLANQTFFGTNPS